MAVPSAGTFIVDTRNESFADIIPASSSTPTTPHINTINIGASNTVGRDQYNNTYQTSYYSNTSQNTTAGPSSSSGIAQSHPFNDAPLDLLSVHYTGRQEELAQIMKALEVVRGNVPTRFALYGNPGVGKSQLTFVLAKESFAQGRYKCIFWIPATTIEKLYQGFSKLLHLVDHPDRSNQEELVRLMAARRWLEHFDAGKWLLVLDNVSRETIEFLREHLPRKNSHGNILFTTRTKDVALAITHTSGEQHEILELRIPNVKDAACLLRGHFKEGELNQDESKVQDIVKFVGCLPLAIAQAAAYMRQTGSTLDALLAVYNSDHKIDMIKWENDLSTYQEKSVAATFSHQLDDLQRNFPDIGNLLKIIAFFDPESIPLDMLITGASVLSKKSQLQTASNTVAPASQKRNTLVRKVKEKLLGLYKGKGKGRADELSSFHSVSVSPEMSTLLALIQSPMGLPNAVAQLQNRSLTSQLQIGQSSSLWMHDLTQLIVLDKIKQDGAELEWFENAVELACCAFEQVQDPELPDCWSRCEVLIPHIQSLTMRQENASETNSSLLHANYRIGGYLRSRGRYNDAEVLYKQILSSEEGQFGPEHEKTLITKHNLALVYDSQGRYNDAELLFKQVLSSKEIQLGPEHVSTLTTMNTLAGVYESQRRYKDAEELYEHVLSSREKQLGLEHNSTLITKHNLALVYNSQGRYRDAEVLYKQLLSIRKNQHGPERVDTLITKHNLALVYDSQGKYRDAEVLFKQVLLSLEKQLGPDHVTTLKTKHCLASVYISQGRYAEAEALLVHVLAGFEKWLGLSHPHTQIAQNLLADVYTNQGRLDDAEKMTRSVSPSPP